MKTIRWGILGTGWIAEQFVKGLDTLGHTELYAVASRTQDRADAFADKFAIPVSYARYEDLAADEKVDAVYVATPHPMHKANSIMCMKRGKAVLCEKPFSINAAEAQAMIEVAKEQNVFLMEAMWTRFLPHMKQIKALIAEGAIGDLRMLQADFGMNFPFDAEHRLFNKELGGGALLDAGVYPVSLAHYLFGKPIHSESFANLGESGVDEEVAIIMRHHEGRLSLLSSAVTLALPHEAVIMGTKGRIHIDRSWFTPTSFTLYREGEEPEHFEPELDAAPYNYEVLEVNRCLREAKTESETMPLSESLEIMQTLDALRQQWGLEYPSE